MEILKSILKMIMGLLGGAIIGFLIAAVGVVCFTDTTFPEFFGKILSAKFGESMLAAAVGIVTFIVSIAILIPLHEAGHLICGLLSGYKFVSFRIFNLTFIKDGDKLKIKKYSIAGTGGQCLLTPPDIPLERINTTWYNFGGVLANIIVGLVVIPFLFLELHPFVREILVVFLLTDLYFILINGIPFKINGAGNDAYNMLSLNKNLTAKLGMINGLRSNALIQQGIRPKDLPDEWFIVPANINYANGLEVSLPLMAASRLLDEEKYNEALSEFEELYSHKKEIIGLFVKELECELVFLRLVCGDVDGAKELLTPELKKYIMAYRKMMSSKERILCAVSLFIDNDREAALKIYNNLKQAEQNYLLQGEVKSDLALMNSMLSV